MNTWLMSLAALFIAGGPPKIDRTKPCDLAVIEDGLYCEYCDEIIEGDLIIDKVYCKDCYEESIEDGEEPEKAVWVKCCVKRWFECEKCRSVADGAGKCDSCGAERVEHVSKAPIVYACEKCGEEYDRAGGLCVDPDCRKDKAKIIKTCARNGMWPHGGVREVKKPAQKKPPAKAPRDDGRSGGGKNPKGGSGG